MKKMFIEKGHLMLKYIINQIAMSFFGLMMSSTALAIGESWLLPFGIFGLLFYWFILISFIREDGLKDALKADGGRIKADPLLSLKYCGIAAVPGFLIALTNMILHLVGAVGYNAENVRSIFNVITRILFYGMYNPIDTYLFNIDSAVFKSFGFISSSGISYVVYTFFTLIVCFLAYNSGLKKMFIKK